MLLWMVLICLQFSLKMAKQVATTVVHIVLPMSIVMQSNRDFYIYYTSSVTPKIGMSALRWKQYKAHFNSHGYVF